MEQHHEQFENEPDQTTDWNANTNVDVEKTETHDIADLVAGWEGEWKTLLFKPYTHRPIVMNSAGFLGQFATEIVFKSDYRQDRSAQFAFGKTYPTNVIISKYPYTIEHDFCLHIIEEAKLVLPSNDEQVSIFIDSIDSSIKSAIDLILKNDSDAINYEQYHIWILLKIALHKILINYFETEINELNAYSRLVRPANAPPDQDLLRPAGLGNNPKTDELVRPSDDPDA